MPTGMIVGFAGPSLPAGWLDCDGAAVSRVFYSELFAVIGVTWGPGDGVNTFNVPDLRGRTILGVGDGAGLTPRTLAEAGGAEDHQLTVAELPAHSHATAFNQVNVLAGPLLAMHGPGPFPVVSNNTGGDVAHPQVPTFRGAYWIIKT